MGKNHLIRNTTMDKSRLIRNTIMGKHTQMEASLLSHFPLRINQKHNHHPTFIYLQSDIVHHCIARSHLHRITLTILNSLLNIFQLLLQLELPLFRQISTIPHQGTVL